MSDDALPTGSSNNSRGGEMSRIVSGQEGFQLYLYCSTFMVTVYSCITCVIKNK